ncbi:ferredoxin--NADP reductase [Nocardioides ginsengisoli]|uniref:2Fe-2S iron-sulfur cluster-binding protein n=1 Tax=Nocardioides ginsengisoli TaxID=363868 RepID=A0ABW3W159_9ACTN
MSAPLRLRVVETIAETSDARSVVFVADDGAPVRYRAGQFLTLRVPGADGEPDLARCYSLSSSPHTDPDRLVVTVKKVAGGRGSAWMCDSLQAGDVVDALRPAGVFTPGDLDQDLLLAAAGSGVTPVLSILRSALEAGTGRITLLYANRDESSVIFAQALADLERAHPERLVVVHWLESLQGLPDVASLAARLAPYADREAYLCGPVPFMAAAEKALVDLLGAPAQRVHREEFVSLTGDPFAAPAAIVEDDDADAAELEVELDGETRTLPWSRSRSLLDVLLAAGLDAPYSCREGACSACACVVREGEVSMAVNQVLDDDDLADGIVLGCQAVPASDRVRVSYDA